MARRELEVNFTQTLDIRLLDAVLAALLRRIQCANTRFTGRVYHFSLNNLSGLDCVRVRVRVRVRDWLRASDVRSGSPGLVQDGWNGYGLLDDL